MHYIYIYEASYIHNYTSGHAYSIHTHIHLIMRVFKKCVVLPFSSICRTHTLHVAELLVPTSYANPRDLATPQVSELRLGDLLIGVPHDELVKYIWVNYSDLTRPHPKWWFMWGIAPQPPLFQVGEV